MERQKDMESTDAKRLRLDWTEAFNLKENYYDYKVELFDLLSEIKDM